MYIYIYTQRNFNQQIPESMGTQDTNKGKEGNPCLKEQEIWQQPSLFSRFPATEGKGWSLQITKQEDLGRSGKQGGGGRMGAVGQCGKVKHIA